MRKNNYKKGVGMIEIIIAVFILSTILGALFVVNNLYIKSSKANLKMTKASYLATEGIEVMKSIRDLGWSNISSITIDTDYYLYFDNQNSLWIATSTVQEVDGFTRKIKVFNVYRDGSDDIALSGTLDSNIKKIEISVSWLSVSGEQVSKKLTTYIANILEE